VLILDWTLAEVTPAYAASCCRIQAGQRGVQRQL